MSGLTLSAGGTDFRTLLVDGIDAGSAAEQAGVKVGDIIETIDSRQTDSMTLDDVRRLLKQNDTRLVLGVTRGMGITQLTLLLHRPI